MYTHDIYEMCTIETGFIYKKKYCEYLDTFCINTDNE